MNWLEQCEEAANALPTEKHQEFLDLMWAGKTLQEAYETAGISFDAANGIMRRNITDMKMLNRTATTVPQ